MEPALDDEKKVCELCGENRSLKDYFSVGVVLCSECAIKHMNLLAVWMARVDTLLKEKRGLFGRGN